MTKNFDFMSLLSSHDYILWDWNGTLLNDTELCVEIIHNALLERGYEGMTKERYLEIFTIPVYDYYEKLNLDQEVHSFEEIAANFIQKYTANRHNLSLYQGAKELLIKLKKNNAKQILFSAAHREELDFQVSRHLLENIFDEISGASDHRAGSKLERGLDLAKKYQKHQGQKGVIVGDTLHDMEIGKEIGLSTVWVSEGHQSVERALGHDCIDYVYDRLQENFIKQS